MLNVHNFTRWFEAKYLNVLMVHKYSGGFLLKMTWPNGISESLRD